MEKQEHPVMNQVEISRLLHALNYRWHRNVVSSQEKAGIDQETIVNGRILGHLEFTKEDVYQKDLEKVVGLTKSAISAILSRMEQKGYIERQSVQGDARLKRIVLTEYGHRITHDLKQAMDEADATFVKGLSEAEQQELIRMLRIIHTNMKELEAESKP
ncbi:MAG: MarR family transcriptional regulator [Lachnospiraceae bacterium]|nr:MarR family transcriptional regulator [Lachnospiraceae bacterium]